MIIDDVLEDEPMDDERRERLRVWYDNTLSGRRGNETITGGDQRRPKVLFRQHEKVVPIRRIKEIWNRILLYVERGYKTIRRPR